MPFTKSPVLTAKKGSLTSRKDYGQVLERTSIGRVFHPVARDVSVRKQKKR